jgi:phytanoyl-CoA hydroxylase
VTHHHDLSAQELKSYQASGYLIRKDVFSLSEITQLRAAAERAVNHAIEMCIAGKTYILDGKRFVDINHVTVQFEPGPDNQQVRVIEPVNELDAELDQLVEDPRLTNPMRSLVGAKDLALWTAKLNLKRPREGSGFGWHQDSPYWIHDCDHVDQLPNVMIAFDDADRHNGCFKVIKGSHKQGCLPGKDDG